MRTIDYTYLCSYTGRIYKCRTYNVSTWADEPYPPGGMLRVMRNSYGQIVAGPMVSELISWNEGGMK